MRVGKMQCRSCLGAVSSVAEACRHCGKEIPADQVEEQQTFEKRIKRATPYTSAVLVIALLGIGTCTYRQATREPTAAETQADNESGKAAAKFLAEVSAAAILRGRMKNPPSFHLVEAKANPAIMDSGNPGFIVAVIYRGTNSFGGTITRRAMVWVDETGNTPLKVIDVD
ncbi:hypothetical protein GCM10007973_28850 [Polymorphobacter multimanifer]|nr:hypothetical protein GCM10007973_28850 [Polymorphobacter multimanifer]